MQLSARSATQEDASELLELYRQTIRTVNCHDYNEMQIRAWARDELETTAFETYIARCKPFVVTNQTQILGYSDLQDDGLIDHFYCHHQAQRQGVGSALMQTIMNKAHEADIRRLYSYVSITAKPFFLHFGFSVLRPNQADIRGVVLDNYLMEKELKDECFDV
ncbi:GNAT family N-acetyltransferase [Vibrio mediterranei]|uniref:N-acetyltransferase domain-containing protein n=1 Tax=Vibrio mediterranei TaxID=689 RepID=A0AAN1KP28_9VIBR|nr:GNAT family N-acetyltransferase [Vibrio mediterranei]ASI91063.1 hypothetical protein BSZ05_15350 [Vibrio mediterranei]